MNSRHCEERKDTRKKMKKFRIDRETLEKLSRIREKKECMRDHEDVLIRHLLGAK